MPIRNIFRLFFIRNLIYIEFVSEEEFSVYGHLENLKLVVQPANN